MIFFDFETTGLIDNEALPLTRQPYIIEIGALKTDDTGKMIAEFSEVICPPIPLPAIITKITGLRDADVAGKPLFVERWRALAAFWLGERQALAHNARFDQMMLAFELRRCEKEFCFPWAPELIDTRERWPGKLAAWARKVKGEAWVQNHRALDDCRLLRDCWFATGGA